MNHGLIDIDHLLTSVIDVDAAASTFERMGFTVTPISRIESMSVANRMILMKPSDPNTANFVEFMGMIDGQKTLPSMRRILDGTTGLQSMVLATRDAKTTRSDLTADRFPVGELFSVARQWPLPDGQILDIAFNVTIPVDGPLMFNVCEYLTRQHYVREQWLAHENTAQSLCAVICASTDPQATANYFADLFGCSVRSTAQHILLVKNASVALEIYSQEQLAQRYGVDAKANSQHYVGYRISVSNLETLMQCLLRGDIAFRQYEQRIVVAADLAHGCLVEFVSASDMLPQPVVGQ